MAVKCIALDLDRTTLNKEGRLSEGNRKALEEVIAAGIHVVIASGRAFDTLPQDILSVAGIEYAITGNGAAMYHLPTGKCLKRSRLSKQAVEAIMNATKAEDVTYEAFIDGIAYADKVYLEDPQRFGATACGVAPKRCGSSRYTLSAYAIPSINASYVTSSAFVAFIMDSTACLERR